MKPGARFVGALIALAISVSSITAQEVVTVCGASAGYSYYLEFMGPKGKGWEKDGIKEGMLTVLRDATGAYDIIVKTVGETRSAKGNGAHVAKVHGSDSLRFTLVVVSSSDLTDTYQFTLDQMGRGTVIWSSLKNTSGFTKGFLFTATCSK